MYFRFLFDLFGKIYEAVSKLKFSIFPRKLSESDREILTNYFPYYARMNPKFQKEFEVKLEQILTAKTFHGRGGIEQVTQEMEILIGATITMVVFGWKSVVLPNFDKILIYPDTYYSTINHQYHRGEVNPRFGLIVVSWRCFLDGLINESDGVNLGIHEVAHALKLENYIYSNEEVEFLNPDIKRQYILFMNQEIELLKNGKASFFRESAKLNEDEFFAVSLECFFEKPEKFLKERPEFFKTMTLLLQQNPLVVSPKKDS